MPVSNPFTQSGVQENVRPTGVQSGISSLPTKGTANIGSSLRNLASTLHAKDKENEKRITDIDGKSSYEDAKRLMSNKLGRAVQSGDTAFLKDTQGWGGKTRNEIVKEIQKTYNVDFSSNDVRSQRIRQQTYAALNSFDASLLKYTVENKKAYTEMLLGKSISQMQTSMVEDASPENLDRNMEELSSLTNNIVNPVDEYKAKLDIGDTIKTSVPNAMARNSDQEILVKIIEGVTGFFKTSANPVRELLRVSGDGVNSLFAGYLEASKAKTIGEWITFYGKHPEYFNKDDLQKGINEINKEFKRKQDYLVGKFKKLAEEQTVKKKYIVDKMKKVFDEYITKPLDTTALVNDNPVDSLYSQLKHQGSVLDEMGGENLSSLAANTAVSGANILGNALDGNIGKAISEGFRSIVGAYKVVARAGKFIFQQDYASSKLKKYFSEVEIEAILNTPAIGPNVAKALNSKDPKDREKIEYIKDFLIQRKDKDGKTRYYYKYFHLAVQNNPNYRSRYGIMLEDARVEAGDEKARGSDEKTLKRESAYTLSDIISSSAEKGDTDRVAGKLRYALHRRKITLDDFNKGMLYAKNHNPYQAPYELREQLKGMRNDLRDSIFSTVGADLESGAPPGLALLYILEEKNPSISGLAADFRVHLQLHHQRINRSVTINYGSKEERKDKGKYRNPAYGQYIKLYMGLHKQVKNRRITLNGNTYDLSSVLGGGGTSTPNSDKNKSKEKELANKNPGRKPASVFKKEVSDKPRYNAHGTKYRYSQQLDFWRHGDKRYDPKETKRLGAEMRYYIFRKVTKEDNGR